MLALNGIYQNGTIILETPLLLNKTAKVIVTFIDDEFVEYDKILLSYLKNNELKTKKYIDLTKFSFLQSIEATKEFDCSISEELINERRTEL